MKSCSEFLKNAGSSSTPKVQENELKLFFRLEPVAPFSSINIRELRPTPEVFLRLEILFRAGFEKRIEEILLIPVARHLLRSSTGRPSGGSIFSRQRSQK